MKERKEIRASACEVGFKVILANSAAIGMCVNSKKTQLLCISPALHSETTAFILDGQGGKIVSEQEMTILGFCFGSRPNLNSHMDLVTSKYNNACSWIVRHLKLSGVSDKDIALVFSTTIRSCIKYASVVYNSMLTKSQSDDLERMQRRALKIIYGHKTSYADTLEKSGLKTLEERRTSAFEKFTKKASVNPRL